MPARVGVSASVQSCRYFTSIMFHTVAVHHANVQTTRGEGELRQHDPQSGHILARMTDCVIG